MFQIVTFYKFKTFDPAELLSVRESLRSAILRCGIKGTVILATEGFNSTVCGRPDDVAKFMEAAGRILDTRLEFKSSFHNKSPFRRSEVKIKPEIVTLRKTVDISKGEGTHVSSKEWNRLISDPDITLIDARNHYEFRNGTFKRAIDPGTLKFSELPQFVSQNLDPAIHKKVAMFCTGGIRCEKFAPFMKELGFGEVYQLEGGILKYLEEMDEAESLWSGECFVFDDRVTVDRRLAKGGQPDFSLEGKSDPG